MQADARSLTRSGKFIASDRTTYYGLALFSVQLRSLDDKAAIAAQSLSGDIALISLFNHSKL